MALQIWLPLDGTLENKGCLNEDIGITATPVFVNNGKIGSKAVSTGTTYMPASMTEKVLNNREISICFWIYVNQETGSTASPSIIFGNGATVANNNRKFSLFQYPTCNDLHYYWQNDTASQFFVGGTVNNVLPSYQWTHVAVTYNNPIMNVYINGTLIKSVSGVSNSATFAYNTPLFDLKNNHRYLNDLRIYDHCLSQAEVHEISQGLVLHYKLNGIHGGVGENLLRSVPTAYVQTSYLSYKIPLTENFVKGETYTFQAWDVNVSHSGKTEETTGFGIWWGGGSVQLFSLLGSTYFTNGHADYICKTFTAPNSTHANTENAWIEIYNSPYNADGTRFMSIGKWKLEKGSKSTGYIENDLDTGADTTRVADSSGYGHDGTGASDVTYELNSPRYNMCYSFNGNIAHRIYYNEPTFNYTDNFSYTLWVKANYTGTAAQFIFTNGRADYGEFGYGIQNVSDTSLGIWFGNKRYAMAVDKNTWTHVAFTKSGTVIKLYKNGTVYSSITWDGTNPTYGDGKGLGLGCFHYTGNIYPGYGSISDFRIYCTPLSADDIKDIYQTSAKIDNLGNIHAFEIIEEDNVKIRKEGVFALNNAIESEFLFNDKTSFSFKPAANINNSTVNNVVVDFGVFAELCQPLTISVDADISWSNFKFGTDGTGGLTFQGDNRIKESGTFVWENTNYTTSGLVLTNEVSNSENGSKHISKIATIPVSWFDRFDASRFGMRCNYSDGNGTITVSNIKVTLASSNAKINKKYVSANEFIER